MGKKVQLKNFLIQNTGDNFENTKYIDFLKHPAVLQIPN